MEGGSLLKEALQHGRELHDGVLEGSATKNVLILDVYSLERSDDEIQGLLSLAKLATECNSFLQSKGFRWHYGGDGPVFGVCAEEGEGIPHLRAFCRYGPNLADEWIAIDFMLELSQQLETDVAVNCWDAEDGQVILIQAADDLPDSFDQDPTDSHRYACWIRGGTVQLFTSPHIGLEDALNRLKATRRNSPTSHYRIQNLLKEHLMRIRDFASKDQQVPLVLPRNLATLIRNRPDLLHAAIQAFCDHSEEIPPDLTSYSDWVWTTATLSRTNYAMVRTLQSSQWQTVDSLPPTGVEVKRYKRQCQMDSSPHLRYGVSLGVRVAAGIEFLLKQSSVMSSTDQRIYGWSRIGNQTKAGGDWISQSFEQGPNHSQYDLSNLLKCPVYPEDSGNSTLYSYPQVSMRQQLLNAQQSVDLNEDFPIPSPNEVDDEEWLFFEGENDGAKTADLDSILSRFQSFMVQSSEVDGVATKRPKSRLDIRPRVFLNILHGALKGVQLSFPEPADPFFYDEDYDLMNADNTCDTGPRSMRRMMEAMDFELEEKTTSRKLDPVDRASERFGATGGIAENAHVLGNLLESVQAGAGEAGPVPNMMKEMEPKA